MYYSDSLMNLQTNTMFESKVLENFFNDEDFVKIQTIAKELEKLDSVLHSGQTYTKFNYYKSD